MNCEVQMKFIIMTNSVLEDKIHMTNIASYEMENLEDKVHMTNNIEEKLKIWKMKLICSST